MCLRDEVYEVCYGFNWSLGWGVPLGVGEGSKSKHRGSIEAQHY